jgi:hypothetical protein
MLNKYDIAFRCWIGGYQGTEGFKLPNLGNPMYYTVKNGKYIRIVKTYLFISTIIYWGLLISTVLIKWYIPIILLIFLLWLIPLLRVVLYPSKWSYYQNGGYHLNGYWKTTLYGFVIYPIIILLIVRIVYVQFII